MTLPLSLAGDIVAPVAPFAAGRIIAQLTILKTRFALVVLEIDSAVIVTLSASKLPLGFSRLTFCTFWSLSQELTSDTLPSKISISFITTITLILVDAV